MARFSDKCEQYFRINFENKFNFQNINLTMIKARVTECIVALDLYRVIENGRRGYKKRIRSRNKVPDWVQMSIFT